MSKRDVVVLSAARSAVGTFGGSLSDLEPSELAGIVMKETIKRSGADPKLINYVTVGNTIPTESRSAYVARVASIQAGLPMESVAMAVNRLCSSGLQAIVTTAQNILLGDCDFGMPNTPIAHHDWITDHDRAEGIRVPCDRRTCVRHAQIGQRCRPRDRVSRARLG